MSQIMLTLFPIHRLQLKLGSNGGIAQVFVLYCAGPIQGGLPPTYVPALMRGSRVKGPLLFWSEGVARTGALGMVK